METKISPHFSETQEKYNQKILEISKTVLEKIDIPDPLFSTEELHISTNYLELFRHIDANAFRLDFSARGIDSDGEKKRRLTIFDGIMSKLENAGIKVFHHATSYEPEGGTSGFTGWEFLGVTDEARDEETTNQATILEICEMIAKKIGVELDI